MKLQKIALADGERYPIKIDSLKKTYMVADGETKENIEIFNNCQR